MVLRCPTTIRPGVRPALARCAAFALALLFLKRQAVGCGLLASAVGELPRPGQSQAGAGERSCCGVRSLWKGVSLGAPPV
jgi:hypothetical protein